MKLRKLIVAATLGTATVFSSLALAANDDGHPKQSVGEYTSDAAITTKIKAAIVGEKDLSALDIAVETNNGIATLTGTVGTSAQADHAARVARNVAGVKQVMNNVKVDHTKSKS